MRRASFLVILVGVLAGLASLFDPIVLLNPPRRMGTWSPRDGTQLRGIHQSFVVWAQNSRIEGDPAQLQLIHGALRAMAQSDPVPLADVQP